MVRNLRMRTFELESAVLESTRMAGLDRLPE